MDTKLYCDNINKSREIFDRYEFIWGQIFTWTKPLKHIKLLHDDWFRNSPHGSMTKRKRTFSTHFKICRIIGDIGGSKLVKDE